MASASRIEGIAGGSGRGVSSGMTRASAGKASGAKAKLTSTGKAKVEEYKSSSTKRYEAPVKGSGKPKYQNVTKEGRVDTKAARKEALKKGVNILKPIGVKPGKQEITRKAGKEPNIAKMIDREAKELKGQRTPKRVPGVTPKLPVKKK